MSGCEGKAQELSCQVEPEKCCIECSLRFVTEGEQSAGHLIFPQRHAAAQGWGFARYVQWREKGPGDLNVFTQ